MEERQSVDVCGVVRPDVFSAAVSNNPINKPAHLNTSGLHTCAIVLSPLEPYILLENERGRKLSNK